MNNDEVDALEQAQKIYEDVSGWLNFCEIKHAGMFAAYVALFIAIMQSISEIPTWSGVFGLAAALLCACINGVSFVPFLNQSNIVVRRCRAKISESIYRDKNLVFYQAIFAQSVTLNRNGYDDTRANYKNEFLSQFGIRLEQCSPLLNDYLSQIVDVSLVASVKAYLFTVACKCSIIFIASIICMLVCIA